MHLARISNWRIPTFKGYGDTWTRVIFLHLQKNCIIRKRIVRISSSSISFALTTVSPHLSVPSLIEGIPRVCSAMTTPSSLDSSFPLLPLFSTITRRMLIPSFFLFPMYALYIYIHMYILVHRSFRCKPIAFRARKKGG